MNDFTKDELITIKNGDEYLSDRTSLSKQYIEQCETIVAKLRLLIDNYCEHTKTYYSTGIKFECIECKDNKTT